MSEETDPEERAAYDWDDLPRDLALMTTLTLSDASSLVVQIRHGMTLTMEPGPKARMLHDIVPYDIAQPLVRLLTAAQEGEYATVGANLRLLMMQAQAAVQPQEESI